MEGEGEGGMRRGLEGADLPFGLTGTTGTTGTVGRAVKEKKQKVQGGGHSVGSGDPDDGRGKGEPMIV